MIESFQLFSIEARRVPKSEVPPDVRKDYKSNVSSVEVVEKGLAEISFGFMVQYANVGIVRMEGVLLYDGPTKKLKKRWVEEKQMPDAIASEVHTAIMEGCIPEAVIVARDIGLPAPIPMPRLPKKR